MESLFSQFKLNKQLLMAVEDMGFKVPTPIQEKAIPVLLSGQHLLGIAQTGTGKTAAYLLPILMKCKFAQGEHARALILAPTRELVMQIADHAKLLSKNTDLRVVSLYGGLGPKTQLANIEAGVDIIVSTPGRFLDLYRMGAIHTKSINQMVLDEADKMLDMGFMPQINAILEVIPQKKQAMLFSATMSAKVERLTENFLDFPIKIEIAPQASTKEAIEQRLYKLPNLKSKISMLLYLIDHEPNFNKVIVFTKTKTNADNLGKYLERRKVDKVRVIHANKGQNTRIHVVEEFRNENVRILVATDVACRGIDISEVSHVVCFDVPVVYEDYVHRIGRTGRADKNGTAITFCNMAEEYHVGKIEEIIRMQIPVHDVPSDVELFPTSFEERQEMLKEIDNQRKKEDPTFQGAFHEKKNKPLPKPSAKGRAKAGAKTGAKTGPKTSNGKKDAGKNISYSFVSPKGANKGKKRG